MTTKIYNHDLDNKQNLYPIMLSIPIIGVLYKTITFFSMIFADHPYSIDFITGIKVAFSTSYIWLGIIVAMLSFTLLYKTNKSRLWYLIAFDIFYTINCYIYVCYYRYFNEFPSIYALMVLKSTNSSIPSDISNLLVPIVSIDIVYFSDFMLLCIVGFIYKYVGGAKISYISKLNKPIQKQETQLNPTNYSKNRRICTSAFTVVIAIFMICAITLSIVNPPINVVDNSYISTSKYEKSSKRIKSTVVSPLGVFAGDVADTLSNLTTNYTLTNSDIQLITEYYDKKNSNYAITDYFGRLKDKNVIFIQFEAFEDFVIGKEINGQEITPNINRLLSKSYHFTNVRENTKHGNSSDADILYVGGMLPASNVSTSNGYGYNVFNGTPKILRNYGYKSAYFSCDELSAWNYLPLSISMGYDNVVFNFDQSNRVNTYISDESMLDQTIERLLSFGYGNEKFYSHSIIYSNHAPFKMPENIKALLELPEELKGTYTGNYFQSVHYSDKCIGEFIEKLERSGLLENSVVVIAGDHRGLHKYFANDVAEVADKTQDIYGWIPKSDDVPLGIVIYDPSMDKGETIDTISSQIDIMPTLMYLLGVDYDLYKDTAMGVPIFIKPNVSIDSYLTFRGTTDEIMDNLYLYYGYEVASLIYKSDYFGEEYIDSHVVNVYHYNNEISQNVFKKKNSKSN